jgi:thioesterase domain-containing protein
VDAPAADDAASRLTASLWATIPLSRTMAVRCSAHSAHDSDPLQLAAPFCDANRNVHGTAFAGSVYAAAVLAGWAWAEAHAQRSPESGLSRATVVVKAASIRYRAPLRDAFVSVALPPAPAALKAFAAEFEEHGKATLRLHVAVWTQADAAAGAALAEADAAAAAALADADSGADACSEGTRPLPVIVTPDGRKPACILDGEFTAFTPA